MSGSEARGVRAVVDGDGHLMEDANLWIDYIEPGYRDVAPRLVADGDGARLMMDGRTVWISPGLPGSSEPPGGWLPFGDARARESRRSDPREFNELSMCVDNFREGDVFWGDEVLSVDHVSNGRAGRAYAEGLRDSRSTGITSLAIVSNTGRCDGSAGR